MKLLKNAKWEKWPLSILKVILMKSNTLQFLKKLYFHSITNNNGPLEKERNPTLCYGICWPNFLSEATFSRTNFWFIIFSSFLLHKILHVALVFNMFIYAKDGHSKFAEMHGQEQIFIDPHWYFILDTGLILRSIELFIYIDKCMCKR